MRSNLCFAILWVVCCATPTSCWHDLDNSEYDCWPLERPDDSNMISCGGLEMAWVLRPPETVKSGEVFAVVYSVSVRDSFYSWAVDNDIFPHSSIEGAEDARRFCEHHDCPANWKDADGENCCIHHANIHSCPLGYMTSESICGPWIPDDGKIFTHTISTSGKMTQTNWSAKVVLFHVGLTSLIAHIRVGRMQVALEAKSTVLPSAVCGDGECQEEELCSTCPADCGQCPMTASAKLAIGLPLSLLCLCFVLTATWLRYQQQKLLWDESWIIDFDLIKQDLQARVTMSSLISMAAAQSDSNTSCVTALASNGGQAGGRKTTFTCTGIYDGRTVAIKKIPSKSFSLSKTIRQEVKQVRELDHPNLCKFIGGCIQSPSVAIITEYCPKGSLNDVLLNEEIPLNWGFRFSFAVDIAKGMAYLHQHRICHGHLKSLNCVLDDRWVCKITDYGLRVYRRGEGAEPPSAYQQRLQEVYKPPEFQEGDVEPTLAGDVFSFSIILLEIATRSDPVPVDDSSLECSCCPPLPELISSKADNNCPCPTDYVELIRRCGAQNPTQRPTFEQIRKFVYRINPIKVSPVDMMMNLMEKYSKHLEVLVAERTQDLMHEKQKTDRLLYSMLPRQVADDLRQGKPSQAQSYVSATVFFSDIVGFTQLSSSSTPYQVVDFLNKLYTTFDDIIDNYDVYKVETIGDAYMVVSGVPQENGILHASEIASMALDLVAVCRTFRIPHKPNTQLQIRAGIHSGPVVAGVVGTKMPRYCLFGDTVNTASRMESTSLALKIQCSASVFYLLEEIGGYVLACRGTLPVKGKGDMVTYWLDGKTSEESDGKREQDLGFSLPGALDAKDRPIAGST
ncbi:atrial natriuretic peptide receptor 1-like [Corythoichthys intestinalis]|uniref:atrial natriuretic peptide receptor 1-like n=1 Tax=Corythoichthys intestinalis TaxID=161448 RepID=UPI0025A65162|nr:atrial natriuretic peptide receptor 1-like [Corythoichthys intestinalis]XP_061810906.1 atrial natriuretic peptide receptor 1-like [Nerophis lumbriciformis]